MKQRLIHIIFLLVLSVNLLAQQNDSITRSVNAFEDVQLLNTWALTNNPASSNYQPYREIVKAGINYNFTSGDFYRSMAPASSNTIIFSSEGYKKINNLNFYGNFKYLYGHEFDLNYNNTLFVSADNPFIFADTIRNKDYTSEIYNLNGRVTYQTKNLKNIFSIDFDYYSGNKYCERDPRADINSIKALFNGGYIRTLTRNWQIGLNGQFGKFSEEINEEIVGNKNYYFFRLKGLGLFENYLEENETTVLYDGYSAGIGFQIKYSDENIEYLSELKLQKEIESSQEGTTTATYRTGDYIAVHPGMKQLIRLKRNDKNHDFVFDISYNKQKGKWYYQQQTVDYSTGTGTTIYEIINESIIYQKKQLVADLNYRFSKMSENVVNYYLFFGSELMLSETNSYPNPYYEDIDNLSFYLAGYKDLHFDKSELAIKVTSGYHINLSEELNVKETSLSNIITYPDHAYMSSDFVNFDGEIKYSLKNVSKGHFDPYIILSANYKQALENNDFYKDVKRVSGNIGIGMYF